MPITNDITITYRYPYTYLYRYPFEYLTYTHTNSILIQIHIPCPIPIFVPTSIVIPRPIIKKYIQGGNEDLPHVAWTTYKKGLLYLTNGTDKGKKVSSPLPSNLFLPCYPPYPITTQFPILSNQQISFRHVNHLNPE